MKEQVYKPLPFNLAELKARVKREMRELPESLVRKPVCSMKKSAARVVSENGFFFRGKQSGSEYHDQYVNYENQAYYELK